MYDECERSRPRRCERDKRFCTDIGPRTLPAPLDRSSRNRCKGARQAIARHRGYSPARGVRHRVIAPVNIQRFFRDRRTPPGCSEPSQVVTFVRVRDDIVRNKFPAVGLRQSCAHGSALIIAHDVGTGTPRLDFAGILSQLLLVLLGPRFDLFKQPSRAGAHLNNIADEIPSGHRFGDAGCHGHTRSVATLIQSAGPMK